MRKDASALVQELGQILGDEGASLASNDAARLAELAHRKLQVLQQLAPMLRAMDASQRPLTDLRDAARLNALNASLIAQRQHSIRAGLAALGIDTSATIYGHDGGLGSRSAPHHVRASA